MGTVQCMIGAVQNRSSAQLLSLVCHKRTKDRRRRVMN